MSKLVNQHGKAFDEFVEGTGIRGYAELVLTDAQGNVKQREEGENMIVTSGLSHIASRMIGTAQAVMGWMAVGTTNTAEATTQTLLLAEIARVTTTVTNVTTTVTNDTVQHVATFSAGTGTGALVESGIFNVVTANTVTMLNRIVFAVINKGASDTLTVTWKIKIA
jgi:hypothetical protein